MAALLAFTAVPAVLVVVVGDPLAGGLGHAWPVLTRDALFALTAAAWLAWAACCAQLLRAVVAACGAVTSVPSPVSPSWTAWLRASPSACWR